MSESVLYNKYSQYLKDKYGEKVYKIPINLPVSCPNRIYGKGCSFCAEVGTGFEAMSSQIPVREQIESTKNLIQKKYKANKFIAYFQNYTNTYLPLMQFQTYVEEAAAQADIVEISISTRPDCINDDYLQVLQKISEEYQVSITIELGLQTVNYHTLDAINRGHSLAEFLDAVLRIQKYHFSICVHIILNLPGDTLRDSIETAKILSALGVPIVKLHSLYIAKGTKMAKQYHAGEFEICSKDEYLKRVIAFLQHLSPDIVVERLFSRIPEEDADFSNWNTSWWKLQDELTEQMQQQNAYQGKLCHYLNGCALNQLKQ